jgi:hypothetical protein
VVTLVIPMRDTIIIPIPKAASSSLLAAAKSIGLEGRDMDNRAIMSHSTRVVMIREPHERIESTWRMRCAGRFKDDLPDSDFASWVVAVCRRSCNDHILYPQHAYHRGLANRVVRWDFAEMASILGVPIPHENRVSGAFDTPWTVEARQAFAVAYAADLALWTVP